MSPCASRWSEIASSRSGHSGWPAPISCSRQSRWVIQAQGIFVTLLLQPILVERSGPGSLAPRQGRGRVLRPSDGRAQTARIADSTTHPTPPHDRHHRPQGLRQGRDPHPRHRREAAAEAAREAHRRAAALGGGEPTSRARPHTHCTVPGTARARSTFVLAGVRDARRPLGARAPAAQARAGPLRARQGAGEPSATDKAAFGWALGQLPVHALQEGAPQARATCSSPRPRGWPRRSGSPRR